MGNQITINENSVITLKDASEILDELFRCGIKTEAKATCWFTGEVVDAYYYDCSLVEEAEQLENVFKGTLYNPANGGKDIFEKDFIKWVHLGWEISLFMQKKKGDYFPDEVEAFLNKQNERNELWKKIKPVFYKNQLNQRNNIQDIQQEKSTNFDNVSKNRKGRPKTNIKDKMIDDADGVKLKKLKDVIQGKIGKDATLVILAAIDLGWMTKPTAKQIEEEFGYIGSQQNYSKYLDENKFKKEEIEGMKNCLRSK